MEQQLLANIEKEKDQLTHELEAIVKKQKALDSLLTAYTQTSEPSILREPEPVYNRDESWSEKVKTALREVGRGYASDVAEKIREHEPQLPKNKAKQVATIYLSRLFNANEVKKVGQEGRRYMYSLS